MCSMVSIIGVIMTILSYWNDGNESYEYCKTYYIKNNSTKDS